MTVLKPKINKVATSGVFKSPLTYPCPVCDKYHQTLKQARKCMLLSGNTYDAMYRYYNELLTSLKGEKTDGN